MDFAKACEVLGVDPNCSYEEGRTAFRNLSLKTHPDKAPNTSGEEFRKVLDAWESFTAHGSPKGGKSKNEANSRAVEYDESPLEKSRFLSALDFLWKENIDLSQIASLLEKLNFNELQLAKYLHSKQTHLIEKLRSILTLQDLESFEKAHIFLQEGSSLGLFKGNSITEARDIILESANIKIVSILKIHFKVEGDLRSVKEIKAFLDMGGYQLPAESSLAIKEGFIVWATEGLQDNFSKARSLNEVKERLDKLLEWEIIDESEKKIILQKASDI
jgi:preprotein translocase subunit Sec63